MENTQANSTLIAAVDDSTFAAEVESAAGFVLVDMWADWCTPCHMLAEHLVSMAEKIAGTVKFVKLDVDNNQATAMKYEIMSLPTLVLFKDGQVVSQSIGFRPEPALMEWLKEKGVDTTPTTVPLADQMAVPMPEAAVEAQPVTTEVTTQTQEVLTQPEQTVTETTTITETVSPVAEIPAPMPVTDTLVPTADPGLDMSMPGNTSATDAGLPPLPTEPETPAV
jgi:thioredoxin 1